MRIYRRDDFELDPEPEPPFRDNRLRELVDKLPKDQRHMVSRVFFGGATVTQAVSELDLFVTVTPIDAEGVELPTETRPDVAAGKQLLDDAKRRLARALQKEN